MVAIDREALKQRYESERLKRIRPDGNEQYVQPVGKFAHLVQDPYTESQHRDPIDEELTFAFIGGGFSGLVTCAALADAGITDVRIIEKGGGFGGVWYWNRYPGAMCDTAAMVYMPLLEQTGHRPSHKYVYGPEIREHCDRIADHYNLRHSALLSTGVTSVVWDDNDSRWIISTDRGDTIRARFVGLGTGPLHRPKLPGIEGLESFAGHSFHTARWDYEYTGGSPTCPELTNLANKRVGIIGTGATAVQCIGHLARSAGELYVFQRTPSSIDVRNNHPIEPDWFDRLEPGWQGEWLKNFTVLQTGGFAEVDLVQDGWTDIAKRIRDRAIENGDFSPAGLLAAYHDSDDEKMTEIRDRVDQVVQDEATAEALKPWYRQLCKRPCFHDQYLQAFNNPSTHLVDTDGKGVDRITETGVEVGGVHYELDCIVFASGFEVGTHHTRRMGFEVQGRDGLTLSDKWADGMTTLHGMHMNGFPNAFIVGFAQAANLISNIPHNYVEAANTLAKIVAHATKTGAIEVEADAGAEHGWVRRLLDGGRTFGGAADCTPGYYNNEGRARTPAEQQTAVGFPEGPAAYFEFIEAWRQSGHFEGLVFSQ